MRPARVPSVVVHGGAGADPADADEFRAGMRAAVLAGWTVLSAGGSALDAVEAAVRALEDHPRFNAGFGSVLTSAGTVEMDASIMEGDQLRCGAVAAVSGFANPFTLARRVMEGTPHVLLAGEGAREFARAQGLPECDPQALVTERQRARHTRRTAEAMKGTVGAVAVDLLVEEGLGQGGLILLDWRGRIGWAHSTRLMPVAFMSPTFGEPRVSF